MTDRETPAPTPNVHARAAAAVAGAVVGGAVGGAPGAVAGAALTPYVEPLAMKVWNELSGQGREKTERVLAIAADQQPEHREEFSRRIVEEEKPRLLAGLAMSAATRTAREEKIEALGRCLSVGVLADDDARVDESHLLVVALDDLEAPHINLLQVLVRYKPDFEEAWSAALVLDAEYEVSGSEGPVLVWTPAGWRLSQLAQARSGLRPVLPSLIGTLQRHGLCVAQDNLGEALKKYQDEAEKQQRRDARNTRRAGNYPVLSAGTLRRVVRPQTWVATPLALELLSHLDKSIDTSRFAPDPFSDDE